MEEEEVFSEKTLSDEEEFDSDQLKDTENLETEDEWKDVGPEESASQIIHITDSEVSVADSELNISDLSAAITGSSHVAIF